MAYTDDNGSFRLEDMEGGAHTLEVLAPGHARRTVDITAEKGETVRVDLSLEPGASISGRVVDSNGEPVASAEVLAILEDEAASEVL